MIKRVVKSKQKRLFQHLTIDRIALFSCSLLILFTYRQFLLSPWASGWDTLPQIELFFKMARLLKQGMVFGYDLEWFGGFPIFIFYGFLPYMLAAGVHVLSGGLIPIMFMAKLTMIGAPILLLCSVYTFLGVYFGKKYRLSGLILIQAFFFSPLNPHMGIGLGGAIHHGLFLNLIGASLILWCISCLEKNAQTGKPVYFTGAILLATLMAFSHVISSMAAALIISAYFISTGRFKQWLIFSLWVLALCFFYLYPYLSMDIFTNSTKMNSSYLLLYTLIGWNVPSNWATVDTMSEILAVFPPPHILITVCFVVGTIKLILKGKWFMPFTLLLYVIFIPSNLLFHLSNLSMHYYRLHCYFFIIYLLVSIYGLEYFLGFIPPQKAVLRRVTHVLLIILFVPLILSFRPQGEIVNWNGSYFDDRATMQYIADQKPTGRVFVERAYDLPNPHLFTVYFPMLHQIPVVFGLLIESADNSRYIVPPVRALSENLVWGGTLYDMSDMPYAQLLEKMGDLGVEFIGLNRPFSKEKMAAYLNETKNAKVDEIKEIGEHKVFKEKGFLPLVSPLKHKPILCINDHWQMSNREIITMIYRSDLSADVKIAYLKKGAPWPSNDVLNQFDTIIYIPSKKSDFAKEKLASFAGKNVIYFVDGKITLRKDFPEAPRLGSAEVNFTTFNQPTDFIELLKKRVDASTQTIAINPEFISDTKIVFSANGPTVINIGYFPYWTAYNSTPIFQLSPSKLLVLAKGRTTLEFKLPAIQKGLMGMALASLLLLLFSTFYNARRPIFQQRPPS